ncbi:cytochrome c3 family protein [Myxococcota bacterium]|nr:cytochrome c3 family protein [Myxococcota bacterium]
MTTHPLPGAGWPALLLALFTFAAFPARAAEEKYDCAGCHTVDVNPDAYAGAVHKDLACTACHPVEGPKPAAEDGSPTCAATFGKADCARCHENEAKEYAGSVHAGQRLPIACEKCHQDIHTLKSHKDDKLAIAQICSSCHTRQEDYFQSAHYENLKKGGKDAPSCADCHGLHTVAKIDNDAKGREFHTMACLKCHDDREMMARNEVTPIAGATYLASFHGKNVRLGYPEKVAGCADCHTAHAIRDAEDPKSTVHADNLAQTCQQCHPSAGAGFAKYVAHADDYDAEKFPSLYWTRVSMTGLLVGTFLFFWIHSVLWALRSFVDRQQRRAAGLLPAAHDHSGEGKKTYRRFTKVQIALHLVVIVSFLTLSLTGLPLKFNGTSWGKVIMDLLGGAVRARAIHHAAAVITFGYFLTAVGMSLRFLFAKRPAGQPDATLRQRLFGPDSLFPNMRDVQDVKAMFKWFFFKGPRPTFERWTYWEKFDFMAVFWGMFAIGLSGLMLWFPEPFSVALPGWMFNIATIVHSDEALLATGFIFTVHFFNTHFRPEKFPMDTVIFNGQISHEEMMEERADQWRRYEAEGRADALVMDAKQNIAWEFGYRIFGLVAVLIGLSLAVLMVVSMMGGAGH